MADAVTVWAVPLRRGLLKETKGTLAIEADALVFTADDGYSHRRIPLTDIRKARRVFGSPVVIVHHQAGGERAQTAFYFAQPPPLQPPPARMTALPFGRSTKRRARRANVAYLGNWNRENKKKLVSWEAAIREAAEAARA